jgi:threonine dehydrogenase-like Zn-dependent dehydrogenase
VVECAGPDAAVWAATELVRPGGTVVLVGTGSDAMALPVRRLIHQEITLRGSVAHLWDADVAPAVAALAEGSIDVRPLLSAVVPLERAVTDGFERLRHDPEALKILVDCTSLGAPGRASSVRGWAGGDDTTPINVGRD